MRRSIFTELRMGRSARWTHIVTVTLTACMFMNAPVLLSPARVAAPDEVLALQSLVADLVVDVSLPQRADTTPMSVLDVQRLLGDSTGARQKQTPINTFDSWAVAQASHREGIPDPFLTMAARVVVVPRSPDEGLQQRVAFCEAPPPKRDAERYRMKLTPHAPPVYEHCA